MVPKICSIEECGREVRSRGFCASHYNRARLLGEFVTTPRPPTRYVCSFDGCGKKHLALGLCAAHYSQRREGTTLRPSKTLGMPDIERFLSKVDKSGDCWEWNGTTSKKGYGDFYSSGDYFKAHRFSYAFYVGPIPEGAEIDHRCRNRGCVNPEHLRPVTRKQNMENMGDISTRTGHARGVSYRNKTRSWQSYIVHNSVQTHLGFYSTEQEAADVAKAARLVAYTHNDLDRRQA